MENNLHTIWIGQNTHQDLFKHSGLRHILFEVHFFEQGGIWFEVSCSVYQFIGGENDSNSNTEWS